MSSHLESLRPRLATRISMTSPAQATLPSGADPELTSEETTVDDPQRVSEFERKFYINTRLKVMDMSKYIVIQVPGDGHCFFHCVARLLQEESQQDVRDKVADYIVANKAFFQKVIVEMPFDAYVDSVRHRKWGDEVEIRAVEMLYKRSIVVAESNGAMRRPLEAAVANERDPITLLYQGENHYNILLGNPCE